MLRFKIKIVKLLYFLEVELGEDGILISLFRKSYLLVLCMVIVPVCMYLHVPCAPQRPEKEPGFTGTGVSDSCESPCGFWVGAESEFSGEL